MRVQSVKILILAQGAYAGITGDHGQALDVLLPSGKGAGAGLRERAQEYRVKRDRLQRYADMCEQAANIYDTDMGVADNA